MRLYEFNVTDVSVLSNVSYKKIMKMLKDEINGGNVSAVKVKNRIIKKWKAGERQATDYDIELNNVNINIKKILG